MKSVFLETGVDNDHVHFLLQSIPIYSPIKITQIIKSITSKKMFNKYLNLKEKLWGSEFSSKGYFMSTVAQHGDQQKLRNYVKNQGSGKPSYKAFQQRQLNLFGQIPRSSAARSIIYRYFLNMFLEYIVTISENGRINITKIRDQLS